MTSSGHTARLAAPRLRLSMRMPVPTASAISAMIWPLSGRFAGQPGPGVPGLLRPGDAPIPSGTKNQKDA